MGDRDPQARVVAIVGPTATGKSELSLSLAAALGAEVINADSMQLYIGMDIGTAKLAPDQRRGVPHHAFDLWEVTQPASVAEYQRAARAAIDDIRARGRVPLLVGGSGLYVRAVLEHFDDGLRVQRLGGRLVDNLAAESPLNALRVKRSLGRIGAARRVARRVPARALSPLSGHLHPREERLRLLRVPLRRVVRAEERVRADGALVDLPLVAEEPNRAAHRARLAPILDVA